MIYTKLCHAAAASIILVLAGCGTKNTAPISIPETETVPTARKVATEPVHHPIRLLVVTGGHPYDEQQFWDMFNSLEDVEVDSYVLQDHSELFENVDGWDFDVALFYNMTQNMSDLRAENFMKLTEWGVGLVPLHHGTLSWPGRAEVKDIFGVQFPDAGPFGFHIGQTFTYNIVDPNHPITQGMSNWEAIDETYTNYYGAGVPGNRVLITTDHQPADPELVWVRTHQNSRIANIQGGHDRLMFDNPNFRDLIQRAVYWTAGRLPEDVGGEAYADSTIFRDQYEVPVIIDGVAQFDAGESRLWQTRLEEVLDEPTWEADRQPKLLEGLVQISISPEYSREARSYSLRTLGERGEAEHLKAISSLLTDEEMAHMAVYALEYSTVPEAKQILRDNLSKTSGVYQRAIVASLGREGDSVATDQIAHLLASNDSETAEAAAMALAAIGGGQARKALQGASTAPYIQTALLAWAETNPGEEAVEIYAAIYEDPEGIENKAAALRGLLYQQMDLELLAESLASEDPLLRTAAIDTVARLDDASATTLLAGKLPYLEPDQQVAAIYALEKTGDTVALNGITSALQSEDANVRAAAAYVIGSMGDSNAAKPVLNRFSAAEGDEAALLKETLASIPDEGTNELLIQATDVASADKRVHLIEILVSRHATEAIPSIAYYMEDQDNGVRRAAFEAAGELGSLSEAPMLIKAIVGADKKSDQRVAGKALIRLCERTDNKDACLAVLTGALPTADEDAAGELIGVIGSLRTDAAAAKLVDIAKADSGENSNEAIRALSDWPTPEPADALYEVASNTNDDRTKALAVRGYLQLVDLYTTSDPGKTFEKAKQIRPLLDSPDLKKRLISVVTKIADPASLDILQGYLKESEVSAEAANGIIQLAEPLSYDSPSAVTAALGAIADAPVSDDMKLEAKNAVGGLSEYGDRLLASWGFLTGTDGWMALNQSEIMSKDGILHIQCTGEDPFIGIPVQIPEQPIKVRFRAKHDDIVAIQFFFATTEAAMGEEGSFYTVMTENRPDEWIDYEFKFTPRGDILQFRMDPGGQPGEVLVDYIRIIKDDSADPGVAS